MAYTVVCLDERAAIKEYDVVRDGDEIHRPVATTYDNLYLARRIAKLCDDIYLSDISSRSED